MVVFGAVVLASSFTSTPKTFFAESAPLERLQQLVWMCSIAGAAASLIVHRTQRDRLNDAWLLTLAACACARELDLHEMLNPEQGAGAWGVSYKLSWWTDPNVPLRLKAGWGLVGLFVGALLVAPPLLVRAPFFRLMRRGDAPTWLFLMAVGFLALGYVMDDLLGRGQFVPEIFTIALEETAELIGALLFLASLVLNARRPLTRRLETL